MQVDKLVVVLQGDVRALRTALAQGNAALGQTEVAAGKAQARVAGISKASKDAVPSIGAFRGSLTALVASTLKLPGPLANVTSLLGAFAFGAPVTVGIVAGLAAIAAGYKLIGKEADEASKLVEGARANLLKDAALRGLGPGGADAKAVAEAKLLGQKLLRDRAFAVAMEREQPGTAAAAIRSIDEQIRENNSVIR